MDVQQKDLSYFRLQLQELLNSSFPEKAHDQKFIVQRSSWAANAYEGAFRSGNAVEQCDEIANYILLRACTSPSSTRFSKWYAMNLIP